MAMRTAKLGNGLGYFVLRDGAMYFLAKLLIGVLGTTEDDKETRGAIDTIQEPVFATNSLLGNLGAPLRVGVEEDEESEEICVDEMAEGFEEPGIVDHSLITEEPCDPSDV
ncbi:hypothetical protein BD410DRAFT_100609 [Rickenella mellea]|uniref:Uncharacterized protein n=1 Tax=Rickenella mellea TaxID=50990 RepID=A0A4Y7PJT6_9AGAM|nr:hypothetical protein BD410DRAFT_100609 [Rickenella mellea]